MYQPVVQDMMRANVNEEASTANVAKKSRKEGDGITTLYEQLNPLLNKNIFCMYQQMFWVLSFTGALVSLAQYHVKQIVGIQRERAVKVRSSPRKLLNPLLTFTFLLL